MCLLGCDIGSSSVKASIVDKDTGLTLASDFLFSSLSTITSCPFRRRHQLALLECPL